LASGDSYHVRRPEETIRNLSQPSDADRKKEKGTRERPGEQRRKSLNFQRIGCTQVLIYLEGRKKCRADKTSEGPDFGGKKRLGAHLRREKSNRRGVVEHRIDAVPKKKKCYTTQTKEAIVRPQDASIEEERVAGHKSCSLTY